MADHRMCVFRNVIHTGGANLLFIVGALSEVTDYWGRPRAGAAADRDRLLGDAKTTIDRMQAAFAKLSEKAQPAAVSIDEAPESFRHAGEAASKVAERLVPRPVNSAFNAGTTSPSGGGEDA